MALVTIDTFKAYMENQRTGTSSTERLQAALDAGHQAVFDHIGRTVEIAGGSSTRVYAPASWDEVLEIHDCTTISAVVENGVTLAATDYQAEPLNGLAFDGSDRPFDQLRRLNARAWWREPGSPGKATVSVTATWGWAAAPYPIVESIKIVAKDIAQSREMAGDAAVFGEIGALRLRMNSHVLTMLRTYGRTPVLEVV